MAEIGEERTERCESGRNPTWEEQDSIFVEA